MHLDFGLRGIDLDPVLVTDALGVAPTRAFRAGEQYAAGDGATRYRPWSVWHLSSASAVATDDLDQHAAYLLSVLELKTEQIRQLRLRSDYSCVRIWYEVRQPVATFAISGTLLSRLAALVDDVVFSITMDDSEYDD